jgi:hypothetical protein
MIEKAFVSGQIAQSIFIEQNKLFIIKAKDTGKVWECTPYEESLFFNIETEIKILEDITIEELRETLVKEKLRFDALYGAIGGFDPKLSPKTRILSMQRAENLVKNPEIFDFVKSRLFGNLVPEEAALKEALKLSKENGCEDMSFIYHTLLDNGDIIDYILSIFKEIIFELSLEQEYAKVKNIFVSHGLFTKLFLDTAAGDIKDLNQAAEEFGIDYRIKEEIPLVAQILNRMKARLNEEYKSGESRAVIPKRVKKGRVKARLWPEIKTRHGTGLVIRSPSVPYNAAEKEEDKDIEETSDRASLKKKTGTAKHKKRTGGKRKKGK